MILMEGADVLSASLRLLLRMHYACYSNKAKARSRASNAAKATDQTDQKRTKKENPKTRKKRRRGWVRIRDLKHPRIHTPPQPRPSVPRPLPGRSGLFSLLYVAIAPLSGSALHILTLHFCKCICPFRVLMLLMNCSTSGLVL